MANRKAITTIVALVLTVAILLAVTLSAFVYIQKTQRTAQGAVESSEVVLMNRFGTCAKITGAPKFLANDDLQIVLKNCGFRELKAENNTLATVKFPDGKTCSFTLNSDNCDGCNETVGIGAFITLTIKTDKIEC